MIQICYLVVKTELKNDKWLCWNQSSVKSSSRCDVFVQTRKKQNEQRALNQKSHGSVFEKVCKERF